MVVCKDEKTKGGNRCIEVASTQEKDVDLEKMKEAFDDFDPEEIKLMSPVETAEHVRKKIVTYKTIP